MNHLETGLELELGMEMLRKREHKDFRVVQTARA
jgi:hypothetical protein